MIEMCDLLLEHASDRQRLIDDPVIQAAAQRWIEVLGKRLRTCPTRSRPLTRRSPGREISGIRVILAHAYFHIEHDIVGNVFDNDVPLLALSSHR
jgi:uncharacterized protein with HEPN domain